MNEVSRMRKLVERVDSMRAWARSRISHCDAMLKEERTYSGRLIYETEKTALEAVLRQVDGAETP